MTDYAKAHISTEQSSPRQDTRFPRTDGVQERASGAQASPREGAQTPHPVTLLDTGEGFPKDARLRNSAEFRVVYASGKRYDGRLFSAFVRPNETGRHRLGITASRKVSRRAVDRNRLKRLLRETFRLSAETLGLLAGTYDWVLNPRRTLLGAKLAAPLAEFQEIAARVRADEIRVAAKTTVPATGDAQS